MEQINVEWDGNLRYPPCPKGNKCPFRSPTCHGRCKGYIRFRAAKDAEIAKKTAERAGLYSMHDRIVVSKKAKQNAKTGKVDSYV